MGVPNENWALSNINKDYEVCSTSVPLEYYSGLIDCIQILYIRISFTDKTPLFV